MESILNGMQQDQWDGMNGHNGHRPPDREESELILYESETASERSEDNDDYGPDEQWLPRERGVELIELSDEETSVISVD